MKFIAHINIMPQKALLDPQGKAVSSSMNNIGLPEISNVRVGKHITLEVEAADENAAREKVDSACKKLLANLIMETYDFTLLNTAVRLIPLPAHENTAAVCCIAHSHFFCQWRKTFNTHAKLLIPCARPLWPAGVTSKKVI
jgi:phosphoribosylformylglycinamidine synthase PurS subunit